MYLVFFTDFCSGQNDNKATVSQMVEATRPVFTTHLQYL